MSRTICEVWVCPISRFTEPTISRSQTLIVPFSDKLGRPSGETVVAKHGLTRTAGRRKRALLLLAVLFSFQPAISFERIPFTTLGHEAVSVWSKITIGIADAYSTFGERPIEDCLRPQRVDCFSVQQNFWISDSIGNYVLWAQNTVELAKLASTIYHGTFTFQVWNSSTVRQPVLCEPESSITDQCRAPFYTTPVPFPQSLIFYSHISNEGSKYVLQMSNNLGAITGTFQVQ